MRIEENITRFLEEMDQLDKTEPDEKKISKAELQQRITELRNRKVIYEGYLDQLEQTGETQILTTDPEARFMQSKDGYHCYYNVQTAVDDGSHLPDGKNPDLTVSPFNHTLDRNDLAKKKVQLCICSDDAILKKRMCLAEHPFGTVKWHHDARYLLCRGMEKATGELGLSFLVYNLKRAINLVGVPALVAGMMG